MSTILTTPQHEAAKLRRDEAKKLLQDKGRLQPPPYTYVEKPEKSAPLCPLPPLPSSGYGATAVVDLNVTLSVRLEDSRMSGVAPGRKSPELPLSPTRSTISRQGAESPTIPDCDSPTLTDGDSPTLPRSHPSHEHVEPSQRWSGRAPSSSHSHRPTWSPTWSRSGTPEPHGPPRIGQNGTSSPAPSLTGSRRPVLQRQLVMFQQEEARTLLKSKDYSAAEPIIIDILQSKSLTLAEKRYWLTRQASVMQLQGRWRESTDPLFDTESWSDDALRGQSLRMMAEARFQLKEYDLAREYGSQALEALEPSIVIVGSVDGVDAKSEFYMCIELMVRIADALGREVEARFYRSKVLPGYVDEASLKQKDRDSERAEKERVEAENKINELLKDYSLIYKDGYVSGESDTVFMSALRSAIKLNDERLADALISDKSVLDRRDIVGRSPLYLTIMLGNLKYAKILIDMGADVNDIYPGGPDPESEAIGLKGHHLLDMAVSLDSNYLEATRLLLDHGADPNLGTFRPPILVAARTGPYELVELLIQKGADVNAKGGTSLNTALHYASDRSFIDGSLVALLCESGADLDAMNSQGRTPLHAAARSGELKNVNSLCRHGADFDAEDNQGATALHHAVFKRNDEVVAFLCRIGADVNAKNDHQCTPLHFAAENGLTDIVGMLCERGADVNARTKDLRTPLHMAAEKGYADVATTLCQCRADPSVVSRNGETPLDRGKKAYDRGWDTRETMRVISKHGGKFKATPMLKRIWKF